MPDLICQNPACHDRGHLRHSEDRERPCPGCGVPMDETAESRMAHREPERRPAISDRVVDAWIAAELGTLKRANEVLATDNAALRGQVEQLEAENAALKLGKKRG